MVTDNHDVVSTQSEVEKHMRNLTVAALVLGLISIRTVGQAQITQEAALDPAAAKDGQAQFAKICGNCHADAPGKTKVGPSLFGVVGRESGSLEGFTYSSAMKNAHITWTPDTLDRYVESPKVIVPGTRMGYTGMKQSNDRHALIAYLNSLH
jgi:cytochrome c